MTDQSSVTYDRDGNAVCFSGPDAVHMFRAAALRSAIGLLSKGIRPTRGMTMTKALIMAGEYTGKTYKRGQHEQAMADLSVWVQTMKLALPSETQA
jgi:hypothetical protein